MSQITGNGDATKCLKGNIPPKANHEATKYYFYKIIKMIFKYWILGIR